MSSSGGSGGSGSSSVSRGSRGSRGRRHVSHASERIKEGEIGAIYKEDTTSYFVVAWKGEPYTLMENTMGVDGMLEAGTPVADAVLYHPVQHALGWYAPTNVEIIVEVSQVLRTGLPVVELPVLEAVLEAQTGHLKVVCLGKAVTTALIEAATRFLEDGELEKMGEEADGNAGFEEGESADEEEEEDGYDSELDEYSA